MSKSILDTHELAWASGFFDGEGSVFYRGRKRKELSLSIAQADRRPLDRFCQAVGIGAVRGPYQQRYKNGKLYFVFSVNTHVRVQAIVAMLWRYLSGPKQEQAAGALREAIPYLRTRYIRGSKGRAALSLEQANALRAEYDKLKSERTKNGFVRIRRKARQELRAKYGLNSVNTLAAIVGGHGY
jgi:hypothetical protein